MTAARAPASTCLMGLSRLLWRGEPDPTPAGFGLAMYGLNILFGAALSAAAGLWVPVALATVLGGIPAVVAWRGATRS